MKRLLEIGSARVALEDFGSAPPSPASPPLVLLHGFTGTGEMWRAVAPALAGSGRALLAFDLPGHGETEVGDRIEDHRPEATIELLLSALDGLGVERFALIGYSLGGRLALHMALATPRRIERLVLESASPGIASESERAARREADEVLAASIEEHGVAAFVDRWQELPLFAGVSRLDAKRRDRVREIRLGQRAAGLAASLRAAGAGSQPWLGARLGELAMPVLLVTGRQDLKFAAIGRTMASQIPGATLAIVPHSGHVPHVERPEAFVGVVGPFLAAGADAASPHPLQETS